MFQRSLKIIVPTAASVGCSVLDSFCNNSDINDSSIINGNVRYALKQPIFAASWFSWSSSPDDYTHYNWNDMKKITKKLFRTHSLYYFWLSGPFLKWPSGMVAEEMLQMAMNTTSTDTKET